MAFQPDHNPIYLSGNTKITNVGAFAGGDAYIIDTGGMTALIDSGFSFCADIMIKNIEAALGGRQLNYCLLSHSHYDHASGSAYLKDRFPGIKIVASEYAAKILSKPSAVSMMRDMNRSVAPEYGVNEFVDKLDDLHVDVTVEDGDTIPLGDKTIKVMDARGHTKCSIAFYIPEENILISSETMGVYAGNSVVAPCYLVGYEMSMDFIKRAAELKPELILVPHYGVLSGDDCRHFMDSAKQCNERLKDIILEEYRKGSVYNKILERYKAEFYTDDLKKIQPLKAFELNASYMIPMIIKECVKS